MADLSNSYVAKSKARAVDMDTQDMDQWMEGYQSGIDSTPVTPSFEDVASGKYAPRRPTKDELGRLPAPKTSLASKVMDNVSEIPTGAVRGVHDAIYNATAFIDPLADWLDENVANLGKYDLSGPETVTGEISKSVAQFMTGFLPGMKALKALGVTNKVAAPVLAGAMSDFATRPGNEGRLADLWIKLDLPQNILTDALATNPDDDNGIIPWGRFKNAVEGAGLGIATEGIILGAKALTAARHATKARKTEEQLLKDKYGAITDEDMARIVGDPSKPMIETHVIQPPKIGGKMEKAVTMVDESGIEPGSVIRRTPRGARATPAGGFKHSEEVGVVPPSERQAAVDASENVFGSQDLPSEDWYKVMEIQRALGSGSGKEVITIKDGDNVVAALSYSVGKKEIVVHDVGSMGGGNGGKLMGEVERLAASTGKKIKLDAVESAIPWYEKRGYKILGERAPGWGNKMEFAPAPAGAKPKAAPATKPMAPEDFETYINFARIDEPEQVKFVIGKMAEGFKGSVDEARRGVITQEQTSKMADDLGMTVAELMERRKGQPFNAEQALAARQLWAASGEQLLAAAKKAAGPNAGDLDQFAFRRAMALHAAIQNEVIGARTETARALASWKIPAGGNIEKARAIEQVLGAMGGPKESKEMARRLALLAESGAHPAAIAKFAQRGWGSTTHDAIKEAWVNGLLSSPKTHAVNIVSNSLVAAQSIYERAAAAGISKLTGGGGVEFGEATAMTFGLVQSMRDAWRMAARALKAGQTGYAFNKIDITHPNAISSEAFRMSKETGAGRFVDFLGHATTIPGRFLGAEDEFFKTIGYRMELNAQALRQAKSEGLAGNALKERTKALIENPPEHIRINSADAAMYNTFTGELGNFGTAVMNLRNVDSPLNPLPFVLPFVRTPANITRYTFERTPFAPLVGQWRADIAAGGARADLALARMSTGTAMMMMAMDFATDGRISGQGPTKDDKTVREALTRSGWQPYSFQLGDRWYSYNRTDPFGTVLGLAASITEAVQKGELDEDDVDEWQEVVAMSIAAVSKVTINKTYLEGFAEFVEVMSDPGRYSEGYVNDLVASFVPMTSLMNSIKNVDDPYQREASTPFEAIQARIIGLSDNLPPRRNLWGEPISNMSGLGVVHDAISPVTSRKQEVDPVDREIVRLNKGPERIGKRTTFDGVNVSLKKWPKVYDEYVRLAGNELKHPAWEMGAKDYLNAVVTGKHAMSAAYQILSDDARRDFISTTVADYRKLAQYQIMNDPKFSQFAEEIKRTKGLMQNAKMPVLTGE